MVVAWNSAREFTPPVTRGLQAGNICMMAVFSYPGGHCRTFIFPGRVLREPSALSLYNFKDLISCNHNVTELFQFRVTRRKLYEFGFVVYDCL